MDNDESKSYFLSCKSHRLVFVKYLFIYVKDNDRYSGIFKATCTLEHSLQIIVKGIAESISMSSYWSYRALKED